MAFPDVLTAGRGPVSCKRIADSYKNPLPEPYNFVFRMKRVFTALLAMLYLIAGAGFTLRQHYCMGEHVGTELAHPADASGSHRCGRCGMEKKSGDNGCCKDQFKTVKSAADHNTVAELHFNAPDFTALLPEAPAIPAVPEYLPAGVPFPAAPAHGPPDGSGPPRFLRLRCIRI